MRPRYPIHNGGTERYLSYDERDIMDVGRKSLEEDAQATRDAYALHKWQEGKYASTTGSQTHNFVKAVHSEHRRTTLATTKRV